MLPRFAQRCILTPCLPDEATGCPSSVRMVPGVLHGDVTDRIDDIIDAAHADQRELSIMRFHHRALPGRGHRTASTYLELCPDIRQDVPTTLSHQHRIIGEGRSASSPRVYADHAPMGSTAACITPPNKSGLKVQPREISGDYSRDAEAVLQMALVHKASDHVVEAVRKPARLSASSRLSTWTKSKALRQSRASTGWGRMGGPNFPKYYQKRI